MTNHLQDKNSLSEIIDSIYAMSRSVEIKFEIKRPPRKEKKKKENRRVRKMKKTIKELRQLVVRAGNEIYQGEKI